MAPDTYRKAGSQLRAPNFDTCKVHGKGGATAENSLENVFIWIKFSYGLRKGREVGEEREEHRLVTRLASLGR